MTTYTISFKKYVLYNYLLVHFWFFSSRRDLVSFVIFFHSLSIWTSRKFHFHPLLEHFRLALCCNQKLMDVDFFSYQEAALGVHMSLCPCVS